MPRRQPLVAEAAIDLENLVGEPADDQPLQVQFRRDAQIEVDVERVVMRDERLCRGAAGDRVQHRRLDFEIAALDQPAAHRRDDAAAPPQSLAALRVHDQVEIALPVAQLDIGQPVILLGKRAQRLGQHRQMLGVDGQLAARRAPHEPLDADQIADIEQLQQRQVVGAQIVLVRENLDFSRGVVQVDEHAAVADRADAARDADALAGLGAGRRVGVAPVEFGGLVLARKADRIRVDAHTAQRFELVEPHPAERVVGFGGARGGIGEFHRGSYDLN